MIQGARFHHTGCLVADIEKARSTYGALFGMDAVSTVTEVASQCVRVCFVTTGDGGAIELIQPNPGSSLTQMLEKGASFYHVAYEVPDLAAAVAAMETAGCRMMPAFASEAFQGRRCQFAFTRERHLIELIEAAQPQ
ncbi:VOC family protein [Brevifollis gellanilyticus]|uniref:Methylmalonyl-CoA epimerase n=1 Tax=Brevifollis gellanilyticus TaxID=748831 RepID=A0A512M6X7_9BACT|nr:VOC family protein [Brevifollis gellanilyticus]GEP42485.1 methylmalonyl-CoA epimerase [Brevifollis gellanilyticus]